MKLNILPDVLIKAFKKFEKVTTIHTQMIPILHGIYMSVTFDEIKLVSSNNNETVIHSIPVDGELVDVIEEGNIVFPKTITEIIKKLKSTISFSLKGLSLDIKCGRSKFQLNCLAAEEYPIHNYKNHGEYILTIKGTEFREMVNKTVFAASTSETRPVLTGVCLEGTKDCLKVVSTDSHRLGKISFETTIENEFKIIVPAKPLENINKSVNELLDVELFVKENQITIKNGATFYIIRLLEGNYPDTSRLIPQDEKSTMIINRKEFLSSLECIASISNHADNNDMKGVMKLHINGSATLSSNQSQTGKGKIEIPYDEFLGMDEFTISLSLKFLSDCIKSMTSEKIRFSFTESLRPVVITPFDKGIEELQLILPVRAG